MKLPTTDSVYVGPLDDHLSWARNYYFQLFTHVEAGDVTYRFEVHQTQPPIQLFTKTYTALDLHANMGTLSMHDWCVERFLVVLWRHGIREPEKKPWWRRWL
jgi:hypothetical protein